MGKLRRVCPRTGNGRALIRNDPQRAWEIRGHFIRSTTLADLCGSNMIEITAPSGIGRLPPLEINCLFSRDQLPVLSSPAREPGSTSET
jgi:hypothetical protein